jgi:hypothetical protein
VKRILGCVAVLLLVAAVPMWAADSRDVVNPAAPGSYTPADPNSPMWSGPEAVLYDNGPLVTHPGGGAGGADASAVQTALGLSVYGFAHGMTQGYRIADDFTISDPGGWDVQTVTFFAYQTGAGTTSTINHVNLQIWLGDPSGGGTIVFGDTTTNRLASTAWSNIYRVLDTNLLATDRAIMADVVTVGTNLAAGTYWLDWQTEGNPSYSGPWAPPVTVLGQTGSGNAMQFDGSTWTAVIDITYPQDIPFIIEGLVVPVELQSFDVE